MDRSEEIEKAIDDFSKARNALGTQGMKGGLQQQVYEQRYSVTYQRLVKLGVYPQLRKRYR